MVRELAELEVGDAGAAFEAAVVRAAPLFDEAAGCGGMTLHRSVEHRGRYWLIVLWDTVSDHEAFRATDAFGEWRALAGPFFASPPRVEHLEQVVG